MLILKNINKKYYRKVVNRFSYTFTKGKIYSIVGPSGCGKSTLLSIISGNLKNYSGKVIFNNHNIKKMKNYTFNDVGFVYQSYQLIDNLTTYENAILPFILTNKEINNIKVNVLFKEFNIYHLKDNKVKDLSGGEKQRIAIVKTLLKNPKILLLDEPTSALDKETALLFVEHLNKIKKDKIIIMVTHDERLANSCDVKIDLNKSVEIKTNIIEKEVKEEKINFNKSKIIYNKVFKNNKLFNYLSTYVLTLGLIGISLSFTLNTFINTIVDQSFSTFQNVNNLTLKSSSNIRNIDFENHKIEDVDFIYYEGIESNQKQLLKQSNIIEYADLNYYDIKDVNFVFDNYLNEQKENIVLAIPSKLSFLNQIENYLTLYYVDKSLKIKVDKLIRSDDNNFYLYCNNTSYLNPIYKTLNINITMNSYLYCKQAKKLYNYLINQPTYLNYCFYLFEDNSLIQIIKNNETRISKERLHQLAEKYSLNYIYSDNINTFIDYETGFSYLIIDNSAYQCVIDSSINDNDIYISKKLSNTFKNSITINKRTLKIVKITDENNLSIIYINKETFNKLNDELIYNALIINHKETIQSEDFLINKYLFKSSSFEVFNYISDFINVFSIFLIIEACISSISIFTINFLKKKKDITYLLNLGVYKSKIISLLLIDPINNIFSSIVTSIISTLITTFLISIIYSSITQSFISIPISISLILLIIIIPLVLILPLLILKIIKFLKK